MSANKSRTPSEETVRRAYFDLVWDARAATPTADEERETDAEFDRFLDSIRLSAFHLGLECEREVGMPR